MNRQERKLRQLIREEISKIVEFSATTIDFCEEYADWLGDMLEQNVVCTSDSSVEFRGASGARLEAVVVNADRTKTEVQIYDMRGRVRTGFTVRGSDPLKVAEHTMHELVKINEAT